MSSLLIMLGLVAGTASALVAAPKANEPAPRTGEAIFNDKCIYCHDQRGWGTRALARRVPEDQAELTKRETLPAAYTALVVRQGIGSMPPFTPTDLSDEEIANLAKWLEEGG